MCPQITHSQEKTTVTSNGDISMTVSLFFCTTEALLCQYGEKIQELTIVLGRSKGGNKKTTVRDPLQENMLFSSRKKNIERQLLTDTSRYS